MGADFLGAVCPMEISRAEAKERLRKYKEDILLDHLSDFFAKEFEDDEDGTPYEQALRWVDQCIDETYDYVERGSRETDVFHYKGVTFLMTGGMSWGDDPTDAFAPISTVMSLELTKAEPEIPLVYLKDFP